MSNIPTFDVIVVGAGLVGQSAALAFSLNGFQVGLVEATPFLAAPLVDNDEVIFDIKVVALSRASENFFRYLGIWDSILQTRHCAYQHMLVWDNVMDGLIEFWACDYFEPNLGYIIEQRNILTALTQKIQALRSVTVLRDTLVKIKTNSQNQQVLTLQSGQEIAAPLVIGADGAHSVLREIANIAISESDYQQQAIVAVVESEAPHQATAFQRFANDGPLALLPLSHPKYCSIVWTTTPENAKALCEATAADFSLRLTQETNAILGKFTLKGKRVCFPLKARHANQYVAPGVALVGDAAHTLHPLAGQGANLGLLDVASLVDMVVNTKQKGRDYSALKVLARYERQRRTHNQIMITAMSLFKQGFESQHSLIQSLRSRALNWVNNSSSVKKIFAQLALGTLGPIPKFARKNYVATHKVS